jgi:Lysylphosphatidylglycerol synthase TM region
LLAVALNLASALVRCGSWLTVLRQAVREPHRRLPDVFSAFFVGIFANGVLPGRVGEVARVGVLVRHMPDRERPGLWPALLGSVLAHRILEVFPSIGLILWVLAAAKIPGLGDRAAAGGDRAPARGLRRRVSPRLRVRDRAARDRVVVGSSWESPSSLERGSRSGHCGR